MKKNQILKFLPVLFLLFSFIACTEVEKEDSFSFAFITDIHLQPEQQAVEGFRKAISVIDSLDVDFVVTGGDLIMDALGKSYSRSDSLFNLYQEEVKAFDIPVYNTIGNHDIYGWYPESLSDSLHLEYGKKMYEKRIGETYYTFTHKGWKFYILDSVHKKGKRGYRGYIDSTQIEWLRQDLKNVDAETPIILSTHIPFISTWVQIKYGSTIANTPSGVIVNSREVLELFKDHNLKLALGGHHHILEDLYIRDIHFITVGAISGNWWKGRRDLTEEGFLIVNCKKDEFSWEYIDYGWEVEEKKDDF